MGKDGGKKIFYSLKVDTFDQTIVDFENEKKSRGSRKEIAQIESFK